uniref:Protein kinase domain-containing protein n=1 Tax=Rhabditophanes sp. KR3021 TaxID=114890 RepID=A0AC35TU69_9BILA
MNANDHQLLKRKQETENAMLIKNQSLHQNVEFNKINIGQQANEGVGIIKPYSNKQNYKSKQGSDDEYEIIKNEIITSSSSTKYEVLEFLGKGTFGQVVKAWKKGTNEVVAIKILKKHPCYVRQGQVEVAILQHLNSSNNEDFHFVQAYECFQHKNHMCIVFEMLDMNLYEYLKQNRFQATNLYNIRPIVQQVLTALMKLKQLGLIHADLKPENIMFVDSIGQPLRIKVIDFGSASYRSKAIANTYLQSRYYRAPEIILGLHFNESIDCWSLGCVMAELFLGWPIYPGASEYDQIRYIVQTQGLPPLQMLANSPKASRFFKQITDQSSNGQRSKDNRKFIFNCLDDIKNAKLPDSSDEMYLLMEKTDRMQFLDLLKKLLCLDPDRRIQPFDALQHSFFQITHLLPFLTTKYAHTSIKKMEVCNRNSVDTSLFQLPMTPAPSNAHLMSSLTPYFPFTNMASQPTVSHLSTPGMPQQSYQNGINNNFAAFLNNNNFASNNENQLQQQHQQQYAATILPRFMQQSAANNVILPNLMASSNPNIENQMRLLNRFPGLPNTDQMTSDDFQRNWQNQQNCQINPVTQLFPFQAYAQNINPYAAHPGLLQSELFIPTALNATHLNNFQRANVANMVLQQQNLASRSGTQAFNYKPINAFQQGSQNEQFLAQNNLQRLYNIPNLQSFNTIPNELLFQNNGSVSLTNSNMAPLAQNNFATFATNNLRNGQRIPDNSNLQNEQYPQDVNQHHQQQTLQANMNNYIQQKNKNARCAVVRPMVEVTDEFASQAQSFASNNRFGESPNQFNQHM